jgi:hypothetical protein
LGEAIGQAQEELVEGPFRDVWARGFGYKSFKQMDDAYRTVIDRNYQPPTKQELAWAVKAGFERAFDVLREQGREANGTCDQLAQKALNRIVASGTAQIAEVIPAEPIQELIQDLEANGAASDFIQSLKAEAHTLADIPGLRTEWLIEIAESTSLARVHRILARSEYAEVRTALASSPRSSTAILEALAGDSDVWSDEMRLALVHNPHTTEVALQNVCNSSALVDLIADHPNTTAALLGWLANHEHFLWRWAAAKCERTPPAILAKLAKDRSSAHYVAGNPNTTLPILKELAANKEFYVGRWVAANPKITPDMIEEFARSPDHDVRAAAADNPNAPAAVLEELSSDRTVRVRCRVAGNPSTPSDVLARMAGDKTNSVRRELINNPNTPAEVVSAVVASWAASTLARCTARSEATDRQALDQSRRAVQRLVMSRMPRPNAG